jgi:hypothetical protein
VGNLLKSFSLARPLVVVVAAAVVAAAAAAALLQVGSAEESSVRRALAPRTRVNR